MEKFFHDHTDTVIFDIGNVLVHFSWREYLESFGLDRETFQAVADAMFLSKEWDAGDLGLVSTEEWLSLMINNAPAHEAVIRKVFAGFGATIVPVEITKAWIQYFRDRNFRIFYLSNYSEEMYRQSKEKLTFIEEFDGGIFSWREKCLKPQPQIYELLLERYQIHPEQAVFFDDRADNVAAAIALGIQGVVFTSDIPLQMLKK